MFVTVYVERAKKEKIMDETFYTIMGVMGEKFDKFECSFSCEYFRPNKVDFTFGNITHTGPSPVEFCLFSFPSLCYSTTRHNFSTKLFFPLCIFL